MERIISAERVEDILNVFGSFDQNLHIIEKEWNVCVTDRCLLYTSDAADE